MKKKEKEIDLSKNHIVINIYIDNNKIDVNILKKNDYWLSLWFTYNNKAFRSEIKIKDKNELLDKSDILFEGIELSDMNRNLIVIYIIEIFDLNFS